MRIQSTRTGRVVDVENRIGQALIALGDAIPAPGKVVTREAYIVAHYYAPANSITKIVCVCFSESRAKEEKARLDAADKNPDGANYAIVEKAILCI